MLSLIIAGSPLPLQIQSRSEENLWELKTAQTRASWSDPQRTAIEKGTSKKNGFFYFLHFLFFFFLWVSISTASFLFLEKEREKEKKTQMHSLWMIPYLYRKHSGENLNAFPVHGWQKKSWVPHFILISSVSLFSSSSMTWFKVLPCSSPSQWWLMLVLQC